MGYNFSEDELTGGTLSKDKYSEVIADLAKITIEYNNAKDGTHKEIEDNYYENGNEIRQLVSGTEQKKYLAMKNIKMEVVSEVGGEDQGSYYHIVIRAEVDGEIGYFKYQGRYDSYNGTEWDYMQNPNKVYPTPIIKTDWLLK